MNQSVIRILAIVAVCAGLSACDLQGPASDRTLAEAIELVNAGEYSRALDAFDEAIRLDGENARAFYNRGVVRLQMMSDPRSAVPDLERATELVPEWADAWQQLGLAQIGSGTDALGYASLERAMDLNVASPAAAQRVAIWREENGDIRGAIDAYTEAVYRAPDMVEGYLGLADIYATYGHGVEAEQVMRAGMRHVEEDGELRGMLGNMKLQQGAWHDAITLLREARDRGDSSLATIVALGNAHRGRYEALGDAEDLSDAVRFLGAGAARCKPDEDGLALCTTLRDAAQRLREEE